MSRKSIKEYILRQREDYIGEPDRRRRSRMLDEVCRVADVPVWESEPGDARRHAEAGGAQVFHAEDAESAEPDCRPDC